MLNKVNVKIAFLRSGILAILFSISVLSMACEIHMKIGDKFKKVNYKVGDELVLEIEIILDHRDCNLDISETKFMVSGCKITGATKWSQQKPNTYFRKLKVSVTEDTKPEIKVVCQRSCDKEGGLAKISLNKK